MSTATKSVKAAAKKEPVATQQEPEVQAKENKFPIFIAFLLNFMMLAKSTRKDEISFLETAQPRMNTEPFMSQLKEAGLVDDNGVVTPKGNKLVLKSTSLGTNFQLLLRDMSVNSQFSLLFTLVNSLNEKLDGRQITVYNKKGEPSTLNEGLREILDIVYEWVEFPDNPNEPTGDQYEVEEPAERIVE